MANTKLERGDEVIIDTPHTTLTKQQVFDYYTTPSIRARIRDAVGGREMVVRQSFAPGRNVLRRYAPSGELIHKDQLAELLNKRLTEIHPTFGKKVDFLLADVDPQKNVSWEKTKAIAETIAKTMKMDPGVEDVEVRFSGGSGFYVQGKLDKQISVDEARKKTQQVLHGIAQRPDVTFGVARPNQIRIDTTPLKFRGSIRAPFSLNAQTGLVSAPVALDKLPKVEKTDFTVQQIIKKAAKTIVIDQQEGDIGDKGVEVRREGEVERNMVENPSNQNVAAIKQHAEFINQKIGFDIEPLIAPLDDIAMVWWKRRQAQQHGQPNNVAAPPAPVPLPPAVAAVKRAAAEFAPGIPKSRTTHPIPEIKNKAWTLAIQQHDAYKAGPHWDFRLVDPVTHHAHSFAVPKMKFPEKGETILGIQQPTHKQRYALKFEGEIPKGVYGGGSVKMHLKEPVDVIRANANRIELQRRESGDKYTLYRMDGKKWGIRKTT